MTQGAFDRAVPVVIGAVFAGPFWVTLGHPAPWVNCLESGISCQWKSTQPVMLIALMSLNKEFLVKYYRGDSEHFKKIVFFCSSTI